MLDGIDTFFLPQTIMFLSTLAQPSEECSLLACKLNEEAHWNMHAYMHQMRILRPLAMTSTYLSIYDNDRRGRHDGRPLFGTHGAQFKTNQKYIYIHHPFTCK